MASCCVHTSFISRTKGRPPPLGSATPALLNALDCMLDIAEEIGGDAVELLVVIPALDGQAAAPQKTSSTSATTAPSSLPNAPRTPGCSNAPATALTTAKSISDSQAAGEHNSKPSHANTYHASKHSRTCWRASSTQPPADNEAGAPVGYAALSLGC